jgi:hypothetical protein
MPAQNSILVELPEALGNQAVAAAQTQGIALNELVRAAVERYLLRVELQNLAAKGARRAQLANLREEDVERLIEEQRKEQGSRP